MMSKDLYSSTSDLKEKILGEKLRTGDLFGKDGALTLARTFVLPRAKSSDVRAMMRMANVYYTAVGASTAQGYIGKLYAVWYLYRAKQWATTAMTTFGYTNDLLLALHQLDVHLFNTQEDEQLLSYGDVHILMSCYATWAKQVKGRLKLNTSYELDIILECANIIKRIQNNDHLKILSLATIHSTVKDAKDKIFIQHKLRTYLFGFPTKKYGGCGGAYRYLMESTSSHQAIRDEAQVACRVARTLGKFDTAIEIAKKYNLADQAQKAKAGL
ncbi:MAG: hypothetical protein RLZZ308_472 [Candidatus Parcubacteria bacterium]|jgi:hypothetical protein